MASRALPNICGIWILRECLFVYVEHSNKLERGLQKRDVRFVSEFTYQLCVRPKCYRQN